MSHPPAIGEEIIVLPNGTYSFTNVKHNTSLDLYNHSSSGPITGLGTPNAQRWVLENTKNNILTVRNEYSGSYVTPSTEIAQDVTLIGSSSPYIWVAKRYPGTTNTFYFVTEDGEYTWYLTSKGDYAVVVLTSVTDDIDEASQWVRKKLK